MIQSLRNTNLNPLSNQSPYKKSFRKVSSVASGISSTTNNPGSVRRIEKLEDRLNQNEQSNRALLEELMRLQNEMKIAVKKSEKRLDEEKSARKQLESVVSSLQRRLSEAEERAKKAEQLVSDTKASLMQLVQQTQHVQRSVAGSQQSLLARKDGDQLKLHKIVAEIDTFNNTMDRLEKASSNMRQDIQDLKNKVNNSAQEMTNVRNLVGTQIQVTGKNNSDNQLSNYKLTDLQHAIQDLQKKVSASEKAQQHLEQQVNGRILNELENKVNKNTENISQRIKKLETSDNNNNGQKINQLTTTVTEMDKTFQNITNEMEKVIAAEIQTRRYQGKMLQSQINESNINLRMGMAAALQSKNGDWKLDALKLHQIGQEAAEDVRQDLEKQIQEMKLQLETKMTPNESPKRKDKLDKSPSGINHKETVPETFPAINHQVLTTDDEKKYKIVGDPKDQELDYMTFTQEKLKRQVNDLQLDVNHLKEKQTESLEEKIANMDRRVTARMDAETRNRNKDIKVLEDEITTLKNKTAKMSPKSEEQQAKAFDDLNKVKEDMAKTKISFRKMAESVQVIKTTLGDKLSEETRIRKEETGRLQSDVTKIKSWMSNIRV